MKNNILFYNSLIFSLNLKLTLTQYIQSKEFEEQKTADKYVSFTVGLDF
jgi:hypothetical protein